MKNAFKIVAVLFVLVLMLCACTNKDEVTDNVTDTTPEISQEISVPETNMQKPEPEEPVELPECEKDGEKKEIDSRTLYKIATENVDGIVIDVLEGDFDADSVPELFVVDETVSMAGGEVLKSVWYVTADGAEFLTTFDKEYDGMTAYECGGEKLVCATAVDEDGRKISYAWTTADGQVTGVEIPGEQGELIGMDDGSFAVISAENDRYIKENGLEGASEKVYYFTFDGRDFVEQAGLQIYIPDVQRVLGSKAVLDELFEKGVTVGDIFYRQNGIININFSVNSEEFNGVEFGTLTLMLKDGMLVKFNLPNEDEQAEKAYAHYGYGTYSASLTPENALYPEKFPC